MYTFKSVNSIVRTPIIRSNETEKLLLNTQFYLSSSKMEVRRVTYGLFNVFTELGGLIKIVQIVATMLVTPISKFLYFLVLIKSFFFAGTDDKSLFKIQKDEHKCSKYKYMDIK